MFEVPIYGSAKMFCDNESVCKNTITPEYVLKKNHNYIAYHRYMEVEADNTIRVDNQGTKNNLSDMFTNIITASRIRFLLERFTY